MPRRHFSPFSTAAPVKRFIRAHKRVLSQSLSFSFHLGWNKRMKNCVDFTSNAVVLGTNYLLFRARRSSKCAPSHANAVRFRSEMKRKISATNKSLSCFHFVRELWALGVGAASSDVCSGHCDRSTMFVCVCECARALGIMRWLFEVIQFIIWVNIYLIYLSKFAFAKWCMIWINYTFHHLDFSLRWREMRSCAHIRISHHGRVLAVGASACFK